MSSGSSMQRKVRLARIRKLKEKFLSYKLYLEGKRAISVTESYQATEGEPIILRRAKALKKILEDLDTPIFPDELIVGSATSSPRSVNMFPESAVSWLEQELDTLPTRSPDPFIVPREVKDALKRDVIPYWRGRTLDEQILKALPEEVRSQELRAHPAIFGWSQVRNGIGHITLGHEYVLKKGFNGIKEEALRWLAELDLSNPDEIEKELFYRAVILVCDAVVQYARRYAKEARRLAAQEKDPKRKRELRKIAEVCEWVPGNAARGFQEAVQCVWFVELVTQIETNGAGITVGRFDQFTYPYYLADKQGGATDEEMLELIECLYIKLSEMSILYDKELATYVANFSMGETITLGGVLEDGRDATNELSYLCLEAMRDVQLVEPFLAVRWHSETPEQFALETCRTIRETRVYPEIINDDVWIPSLASRGMPLKDARQYVPVGCVENHIPGKEAGIFLIGVSIAKCLELALNDGKCRLCGRQMGPRTGDPLGFGSFDDLLEAYKEQVAFFVKQSVIVAHVEQTVHAKLIPIPFVSATVEDCIKSGKDLTAGGARYGHTAPWTNGIGTVADSLAAVKKLVFEERRLTMEELIDGLDKNFDGAAKLRETLVTRTPKFGNDDDYVDELARMVTTHFADEVEKYRDWRSTSLISSCWPAAGFAITSNIPFGAAVGATPNGRLAQNPLSEDMSPTQGADMNGPTASMSSLAKVDHRRQSAGIVYNLKISPSALEGDDNLRRFVALNRAYCEMGGGQVQYNVISGDVLRAAQKEPEKYRHLIVRVAGYAAFFVELNREVQDDIISRTEHTYV